MLTPAIPPIVLPQGGFTKIEREWLERWQDRVKEDHVFVICNKMDLVQVEDNGAMIPREEAIQIYFDHNPMFARFSADDPGPSGRGAMVQMMTASMTDAELDNSARPYRKPDTTALKQEERASSTLATLASSVKSRWITGGLSTYHQDLIGTIKDCLNLG